MSKLFSSLFSGGSSASSNQQTTAESGLLLRPSPRDSSVTLVNPTGQRIDAGIIYSVTTSKRSLHFHRGSPESGTEIGNALIHKWPSSTAEIFLHGQLIHMEISAPSGNTKFTALSMGKLQWKPDTNTGSGLILCDEGGQKIAQIGSAGRISGIGGKKFEVLIPVDESQFELMLFAVITAKGVNKAANDAAFKVLKAVAF